MKIGNNFLGFNISAKGLSIQRKKMNLIAENIANADSVRTQNGEPFQRKFLSVMQKESLGSNFKGNENRTVQLNVTNKNHIPAVNNSKQMQSETKDGLTFQVKVDDKTGDIVHMPEHPDADENGYVKMSNVSIITEMVEMIAASRTYEANLTALNTSKQLAKDSLEI